MLDLMRPTGQDRIRSEYRAANQSFSTSVPVYQPASPTYRLTQAADIARRGKSHTGRILSPITPNQLLGPLI